MIVLKSSPKFGSKKYYWYRVQSGRNILATSKIYTCKAERKKECRQLLKVMTGEIKIIDKDIK